MQRLMFTDYEPYATRDAPCRDYFAADLRRRCRHWHYASAVITATRERLRAQRASLARHARYAAIFRRATHAMRHAIYAMPDACAAMLLRLMIIIDDIFYCRISDAQFSFRR